MANGRRAWVPKLFEPGWRSRGDLAKCPPYRTANGLGRRHAPAQRNGNGPAGPPHDRRTSIRLRQPFVQTQGKLATMATERTSQCVYVAVLRCPLRTLLSAVYCPAPASITACAIACACLAG
jgi:hypothetical protein